MALTVATRFEGLPATMDVSTVPATLRVNAKPHQGDVGALFLEAGPLSGCPTQPILEIGQLEMRGITTSEQCVHRRGMREHPRYDLLFGIPETPETPESSATGLTLVGILSHQPWSPDECRLIQRLPMNIGVTCRLTLAICRIAVIRDHRDCHQPHLPRPRMDLP